MRWNRFWILGLGTLFTCTFFIQAKNNPVSSKQDKPIRTIVIDAGHGGEDPGAKGSYSTEKQVTLEVALKLGKILEENMPDVKVVYTRKSDRFDDPRKKAQIANDNKGELFVSIHCNSTGKIRKVVDYKTVYRKKGKRKIAVKQPIYAYYPSNAKGTETYIWATSKNNAKMESLKQNSVIVLDANSEETKQLMDDTDPETFILLNTLRNAYFDQSLRLSTLIEDEFTRVGRISRGARQRNEKGIWVLSATAMPSVLVELGFISNPEEEDYLNSNNGQQELANCIYKAIKRYREELDRFTNNRNSQPSTTSIQSKGNNTHASLQPGKTGRNKPAAPQPGDSYCVQLLITDKFYKPGASIFRKLHGDINRQQVVMNKKKLNKYIWGRFKTDQQASSALRKARKLGFKDAFVTSC
ncbi:N-acetylmuramoyl-L-alanine amidase family protein [Chitinophaga sp. 22321]|uniref:N-acetylmuramoyl-L-alanine amidase n=1 Tax=Chitinophaga hostae TaxID=2831022 RepID=A0ABS5IWN7_9BACT|nr:N-acetylmuramoyl-L-alanine amidase [Chitinophaga hostae]MBS0027374.1 N-acetylmuramoyl-L-alanine amidase [Chitinophaga hostae]